MRLLVSRQNIGVWASTYIKQKVQAASSAAKKSFVLGLPTGGTVVDMYRCLCEFYTQGQLDFSHIVTFNMDEYVGLSPQDKNSYHFYMHEHLLDHVNLPAKQAHLLDGLSDNLPATCQAYEQAIQEVGGIDLFLGGVGRNGHMAFNEPGSSFTSRTRTVKLELNTRLANARFFDNDFSRVPTHALSVGIGTVLEAKELLFLASGTQKAQAVARLAHGDVTTSWPITALKTHPRATLLVDEDAASMLVGSVRQTLQALKENEPQAPTWSIEL